MKLIKTIEVLRKTSARVKNSISVLARAARHPYWSLGFSGGKDSSVLLDLTLRFLSEDCPGADSCPERVVIIYSDTLLEPPPIRKYAREVISSIRRLSSAMGLNVVATIVEPAVGEDFIGMVIVKGYPAPSARFRWCTDRWKIRPVKMLLRRLLGSITSEELAVITGVRAEEAAHRAGRRGDGLLLMSHNGIGGTSYAPLNDWSTLDVWNYVRETQSPIWRRPGWDWLRNVYAGLEALRMGCWPCTLISRDEGWNILSKAGIIDVNVYRRLDLLRRLWLHMSRVRPELWRTIKKSVVTKGGKKWKYSYSKLKPEARFLLLKCMQRLAELSSARNILESLVKRLAFYKSVLEELSAYDTNAKELLERDAVARSYFQQCLE